MRLNRATIVRRLSPNRSTARDGTRALRFMAGAQITGALGSAFTRFGINLWIYNHTESISLFLVLNIAGALPSVVAAPFASYLLYRVPLRTLILLGNVAVMIGPAAIFLVALTGHHVVELGVATVLLSALVDTFAWPALSAVITLLADGREEERTRINGWLESGDAASGIAGPVLGAFLYSIGGVPLLCGLDVLTVGVAIVATLIAVPLIPRPVGLARRRVSPVRVLVADAPATSPVCRLQRVPRRGRGRINAVFPFLHDAARLRHCRDGRGGRTVRRRDQRWRAQVAGETGRAHPARLGQHCRVPARRIDQCALYPSHRRDPIRAVRQYRLRQHR